MNRIYQLVWSEVRGTWVAVAEITRRRGKSGRTRSTSIGRAAAAALALAVAPLAYGGPTGGQVVTGKGSISQSGNTTTIDQSSQSLSINWLGFNIAPQQTVDFVQPSTTAIAVNRILGNNGSQILGHLDANGQVYLINPNGIVFGRGAQVNVGGLVASTLSASDANFGGSTTNFEGNGTGSVVNRGTISAANGGYVALLGNQVTNQGVITAQLGTVALGAGSAVTLTFTGNSLVHLQIDQSVLKSLAQNGGLISANGGQVLMTAGAKDALLASVVNNTGVIEARTVENHDGTITLSSGMTAGTVNVGGTLDASAPEGGNGGHIETSAAHVEVADDAKVTTASSKGRYGSWLIDPNDFNVAPSGGDITGSTLSSELGSTPVTLQSSAGATAGSGNVNVNDVVSWSANTALTLTASNNVNINSNITATGASASLAINPNTANGSETPSGTGTLNIGGGASVTLSGANAALSIATPTYTLGSGATINLPNVSPTSTTALVIGGTPYTVINSLGAAGSTTGANLQGINGNLSGQYALGSNVDASPTSTWNAGAGFTPIGNSSTPFSGTFDGLGHTVSNLTINLPTTNYVGLFGYTGPTGVIQNVGLIGGSVSGSTYLGGLVGFNGGAVTNSYNTGSVSGTGNYVGGLVGRNAGAVGGSYGAGSVSGSSYVGGLVGYNTSTGTLSNSWAKGNVSGTGNYVGGLVGGNAGAIGGGSYGAGSVSGSSYVGGLVGYNASTGTLSNVSATGNVSGTGNYVGGLAGINYATISNSGAMGNVSGSSDVGGLVGINYATISNSYATGNVSGTGNYVGGLVGRNSGAVGGSYGAGSVSGSSYVGGLVGYNTSTGALSNTYATGNVSGSSDLGGLVGINYATISNSYATGNVSGTGNYVGGLVGRNAGVVGGSYGAGSVSGSSYVGGLVGYSTGTVSNSYATGSVTGSAYSNYVGGLVGYNAGTVSNGYATGSVTGSAYSNYVGGLVGYNTGSIGNSYATGVNGSAYSNYVGGLVGYNTGSIGNSYATGVPSSNYVVHVVGGLVGFNSNTGTISNSYATGGVTGNSDVGGLVGVNAGAITDSYATDSVGAKPNDAGGLVGVNSGTVSNSYATGNVFGGSSVGGLLGANGGTVSNSYATGSVLGRNVVGGLVGLNYGSISNSYAMGSVRDPNSSVGGLVGSNYGGVTNSYATGGVSGGNNVGGLVGYNAGSINNSYATGSVNGSAYSNYVGGLVGNNSGSGTVSNSYATGSLFTNAFEVGGLVGSNYGRISNSYATGSVSSLGDYVGGLVGLNDATISNSYATGSVSGNRYVGGLAGASNSGTISNSYATGSVSGSSYGVGGLVGVLDSGTISNSYATGSSVSSAEGAGGLVGEIRAGGQVSNSYATGSVSGANEVGGLVGLNYGGTVSNSYATGSVSGSSSDGFGGLVGYNTGAVSDSYSTGRVSGSSFGVGGLVGYNYGTVSNSFWNTSVNGSIPGIGGGTLTGATGLTAAQMQVASNFSGFSFTTTPGASGNNWVIVDTDGTLNNASGAAGATFPMLASEYSTTINNAHQLQLVAMNTSASYTLVQNIDASATGNNSDVWSSSGFAPIGNSSTPFTGTFDGLGHTIGSFYINLPSANNVGLFGYTGSAAVIRNVGLVGGSVTGSSDVGALVGYNNGTIGNSYATGNVSGSSYVGGLVGQNRGTIDCYATGNVSGTNYVGGLVGSNNGGMVSNSFASGSVTGTTSVGGLVGSNNGGTVSNSFWDATANPGLSGIGAGNTNGAIGLTAAETGSCLSGSCPTPVYVDPGSGSSTYGSAPSFTDTLVSANGTPVTLTNATVSGTPVYSSSAPTATSNVGTYDFNYVSGLTLTGSGAANYVLVPEAAATAWTVNPLALVGSISTGSSVYGSALNPGTATFSNMVAGNSVTATVAVNATGNTSTSGNLKAGTFNGIEYITGLSAADPSDYTFAGVKGNYTVNPLALTAAIGSSSSIYGSALNPGAVTLSGVIGTDQVGAGATVNTSTLSTSGHPVAASYTQSVGTSQLTGADAGDYTVVYTTPTANYTINPLALAGAAIAAGSSTYGSAVTPGAVSFSNVVSGDLVGSTASIVSPAYSTSGHLDAGSYAQTATSLTGADKGNYTFAGFTTATGNYTVSPAMLTVSGLAGTNRTYNGSVVDALTGTPVLHGLIGSETLTLGNDTNGTLALANAGSEPITTALTISNGTGSSGGLASNYTLIQPTLPNVTIGQLASVAWVGGATGNWSNAANWAGGAIPDYANVAAVTIPAGVTVTYDAGVPGSTTLSSLTSKGNLIMAAGSLTTTGNLSTVGFNQAGGTLDVGGELTIGPTSAAVTLGNIDAGSLDVTLTAGAIAQLGSTALDVTGATTVVAANVITLANAGNEFAGTVSAGGTNVSLSDSGNLLLGNTAALGTLMLTSTHGTITQAAGTTIATAGATTLSADSGGAAITLANNTNAFGSTVASNGSNIDLVDGLAALTLGNTTATGTLMLTSLAGTISQAAGTAINATGTSSLTAGSSGKYNITLGDSTNILKGAVTASGLNVDLVDDASTGLTVGNTTATGTLTLDSQAGAITQVAGTTISAAGTSTLTASNGASTPTYYNIALANTGDDFTGKVTATGAGISLYDALALATVLSSSGNASVQSAATTATALTVSGAVTGSLTTTSAGGTVFGNTTVGPSKPTGTPVLLNVTSSGAVSVTSGDTVTVGGDAASTTVANPYVEVNGKQDTKL